jgi:ribosomal protein S18 acetylase RimI-like enzyme
MSAETRVLPATEADLPSIKALIVELAEAAGSEDAFDPEAAYGNCNLLMKDPDHIFLVMKEGPAVAGFIHFTVRQTALHMRPSGLIDEVIVSKKYRERGFGKELVLAAVGKCRELGCGEVEVSTMKSNVRARKFYKDCGFEEDSVLLEIHLSE